MHSEHEVRSLLRQWILRTNGELAAAELRDDTPILELGIITSVDVMELILLIEDLRGAGLDIEQLDPAALRDIDSMWRAFFAPAGGSDGR